jgi:NADPH:quinone reductase-like Zn-dependent oxidoreductase
VQHADDRQQRVEQRPRTEAQQGSAPVRRRAPERVEVVGLVAKERVEDRRRLADLLAEGGIHPVLDTVFPLEETAAAVAHIGEGRASGKVVVRP